MKQPAVYIMASQRNGTLYTGVTSNLVQRVWQHREGTTEGFTHQYGVKTLVWYEQHECMETAIAREKAIKKWNRAWKLRLIEAFNPQWRDLWAAIIGTEEAPVPACPTSENASLQAAAHPQSDHHPHEDRHPLNDRHPREGGDPAPIAPPTPLDSRLRGNDEVGGDEGVQS